MGVSKEVKEAIMNDIRKRNQEYLERQRPKWRSQNERIAQQRWEQYQRELPAIQRQNAIDSVWERTLMERQENRERDDDPYPPLTEEIWGEARRRERRENARRRQEELAAKALSEVAVGDAIWDKTKGKDNE